MVKTRRSGENGEIEDGIEPPHDPCSVSDEKASVSSQRELRSAQFKVARKLPRWPTKYARRRRPIRMPRIMFPESDTEPEKYSRRSRPMRVFFAADDAGSANGSVRIKHNRAPRKNYMEDSEDKPIQQNVRRSCRKRKLLHHNFNESWITNELKVRGYPGLYGLQGSSSSDEFYMDHEGSRDNEHEQKITQNHIPVVRDEETQSGRRRRTSARFSNNTNKIKFNESDSEGEPNQTVIEKKPVLNNIDKGMDTEEQEPPVNDEDGPQDNNDNESNNQKPPARLTRGRCRRQLLSKKEDFIPQDDTGMDSSSSESDCELTGPVRRSNRTRKQPAFIEIAPRQTRNRANKFTLRKKYSLRERKPKKLLRRKTIRSQSPSSTSSSSSSSDTEEDLNVSVKERKNKGRQKSKSSKSSKSNDDKTDRALRDIQPVEVDGSVRFTSVGGLEDHIKCLREMVLFPLMYPEVFDKFQSRPPKGVLFHGPPGTGKTLLARALANECSIIGGRKVSFFMRKGADCLKKWVGESERHLKLLFQQANKMKPSIIFFDEIDALAPVRSVRQEQVHTSVVGTLLAEMDGLCDRGEVVVIGATNRVDAVDGALRRAGRFDRELYFPAPHTTARRDILHIYTKDWTPPPGERLIQRIADITTGYGGSDIKALCSEAVLKALKRTYPQVYESEQALLIDAKNVVVQEEDLISGVSAVKATGGRSLPDPAKPLPPRLEPLLQPHVTEVQRLLKQLYVPPTQRDNTNGVNGNSVCPSSLLVCGGGSRWVCGAICGALEGCAVRELSPTTLHAALTFTHEQAVISVMNEARRCDRGCIIYMPDVTSLWDMLGPHGTQLLLHMWEGRLAGEHTLLLATTHLSYEELPQQIRGAFPPHKGCVHSVRPPRGGEVTQFLSPLFAQTETPPQDRNMNLSYPTLPLAPPPPPPKESAEDKARRKRKEDYKLRELRIFLRDICRKLASNRRFYKFTKPVDLEEVTDYLDIVKEPMDLETMMTKVDMHKYNCAKEFLDDIDLICANALEYNPDRTSSDKQIRHEACSLRDHAHALIDVEMDSDFELECQEIAKKRGEQGNTIDPDLPHFIYTASNLQHSLKTTLNDSKEPETPNGDKSETHSSKRKRKRISTWSKGLFKRHKTSHKTYTSKDNNITITDEESKENKPVTSTPLPNGDGDGEGGESSNSDDDVPLRTPTLRNEDHDITVTNSPTKSNDKSTTKTSPNKKNQESTSDKSADGEQVIINKTELENLLYKNVKTLRTIGIDALIELYDQLNIIVQNYSDKYDRTKLPQEMTTVVNRYIHHLGKK